MRSFAVLLLLWRAAVSTEQQASSTMKFSIISSRNLTGHWTAQVQLQHEATDGRPLEVDIEHTTTMHEGVETVLIITTVTAPRQRPGPDYELVPGLGYYKFHTDLKNWHDARRACVHEGAHLAIINSDAETKALLNFWTPYPKLLEDWRNFWAHIGIHDHYEEGKFVTIFDVPLNETGFIKWNPNEPDGGAGQNCGVVRRNSGTLADVPCRDKLAYFCEQEL